MDKKSNTYRINNNSIEFSTDHQYIKNLINGDVVQLSHLEAQVLNKLVDNLDHYCTKQDLFACWSSEYVSDSSLTRVISILRGHFKTLDAHDILINKPKLGYMLLSKLENNAVPEEPAVSEGDELPGGGANSKKPKRLLMVLSFLVLIVAGLSLISFIFQNNEGQSLKEYQVKNWSPVLTPEDDLQYQHPSISRSGTQLIYSQTNTDLEKWSIEWVDLGDLESNTLSHSTKNLVAPVWRDDKSFAYHAYNDDECEIRLVILNNGAIEKDTLLHQCSERTKAKSLAWKDQKHLFFTESDSMSRPHQLYEINIETLRIKNVKTADSFGRGIYGVHTNQNRSRLALLINRDWESTDVEVYEIGNIQQSLVSFNVKRPLFSLGWLDDLDLVYQNQFGGLSIYHSDTNTSSLLSFATDNYFSNPVAGGGKLALLNGPYFVSNIHRLNDADRVGIAKQPFVNFKKASQKAIAVDNGDKYFVSNRNGSEQIYRVGKDGNKLISDFDTQLTIRQLLISKSLQLALVVHHDGVKAMKFTDGVVKEELYSWHNAVSGCIFNEQLLLVLVQDDTPDIYSINSDTFDINEKLTSVGSLHCYVDQDNLYYTRYRADGIWAFHPNDDDEHIFKQPVSGKHNSLVIKDNHLWYITPKESSELKIHIFNGESNDKLLKTMVESIHPGIDDIYYTSFDISSNEILILEMN